MFAVAEQTEAVTESVCPCYTVGMKTNRLYAITVYLLNHGRTTARTLARQFEVSLRTIQRDMDSLCIAGIPIAATYGADGGYEISERFRLDEDFATADDYSLIRTALEGLVSATNDAKARHALEKIRRTASADNGGIVLDFSVLQESGQSLLQPLQTAVAEHRTVEFTYTNNDGETRAHRVEPVAVVYRWYAWYLLAWSSYKNDYRTYKLARMEHVEITNAPFTKTHKSAQAILEESGRTDSRTYTELRLKCTAAARARVLEYLKGTETARTEDGGSVITASVVENEQFWLGTLLSLGDSVEVLSPEHIRRRILESAEKIVMLYANYDRQLS